MTTLQICIGYNSQQPIDGKVLEYSIRSRSSIGVDVRFVPEHEQILSRPREETQTTPFSFTRFLSPLIWDFKGVTIYMDPDMLCLCDIKELRDLFDSQYAVQVVQHDYAPRCSIKYVGSRPVHQYSYARKNWSSLMMFNGERCRDIYTRKTVDETFTGLELHSFANLGDNLTGSLPKEYNFLVGEDNQAQQAKIVHFTNGMPYAQTDCQYANVWHKEADRYLSR